MANADSLTPLILACLENDMKKIEAILNTDQASTSAVDKTGKIAMHHCAERGDLEMFKKIFESDSSVMDKRDEDGYTPLTFAVIGGNAPVVEFLLDKGADMNNVDSEKHSLVHWATVCGHAEILKKLLKKGALVSTPDLHGAHALHYATQTVISESQTSASTTTLDGMEILKILLKFGANVNCTDFEERTPLLWAASCGNCHAVQALLEAGADKHAYDKDRLSALHCSASRGHGDVIRVICKTASDIQINTRDRNGSSPLFYAAALGHVDSVKALLEFGAITDLQDKKLRTPTHCAAAKGQLGTLKILHQNGASFALENYRGDLPIHEAVQAGSLELIEWMLSIAPSYVNATNHDGRTPLHLSAALGHLDTCKLLVEKGANKDALMLSKSACVTSLDLAEEKCHENVIEYLRSIHAQRCSELTPQSVVEEFKKHMETRKLATSKAPKSTTETQAQTEETLKMDQAVATGHDDGLADREKSKKKDKKKHKAKDLTNGQNGDLKTQNASSAENGNVEKHGQQDQSKDENALQTNGVQNHGHKKDKKKHKTKESTKKSKDKHAADNLDSSRTSAGVSEIASVLDEQEKAAKQAVLILESAPDEDKEKSEHEYSDDFSDDQNDQVHKSETSSEVGVVQKKTARILERSPSNETSSTGMTNGQKKVQIHKQPAPMDRFRIDWESKLRSSVNRYAEEKRIFQELANLKRLQIQYGSVQEEVVVRRLIDDFLRGYNVRPGDFQFNTFNAWEKFLYDQLKILYRKEKESLMQNYESKVKTQTSLFEQKQAATISGSRRRNIEDRVDRLSRTYGIAPIPMQYSPRLYKPSFA